MSAADLLSVLDRASLMLRVAGGHCAQFASERTTRYDDADCDGVCIDDDCVTADLGLLVARSALSDYIDAGNRLTAAFRALGMASGVINHLESHRECEVAMLEFNAALARVQP